MTQRPLPMPPDQEGERQRSIPRTSIRLFDVSFTRGSAADILAAARAHPATGPRLVVTANMDHVITLSENPAFRKAYDGAAARTLDGMPLLWLAWLRGERGARRVTGHDLLATALCEPWSAARRVYFICATEEIAEALTARVVAGGFPASAVATTVPPIGFEQDEVYGRALAAQVRAHETTLLVLGVGAPRSEIWVDRLGPALGAPIVLAVGDAVNVAAGLAPRAPVLMQRIGFEWLFRFAHAPRRLFHRYFVRSWKFLWLVAKQSPRGTRRVTRDVHPTIERVQQKS
ncbi:WecB/TagA/CpsF family glycosyltransferase [Methylobacterium sp. BTF04]|uniref:WecB/TagA/CpsF family glycosyltransferase n=1 Tax=Methylobacterium sp. BTF04 TaxID=2708300 RepID=UPI0013D40E60|nr:WecB/TagA/CpsF family glycosyltransferase [Methylobacterium sp. BTF04]NEU13408.1 WecB/TagA/CpsF family glycosyltransferase [Methylobacterium sp. BTF04]